MSLTVQQLLADARRLSTRLRDHDQTTDQLISRTQEVLKEVEAMRQYEEDVDNLNEVAHNRPRAHLVLGIQQENRHIRTLQQENKELRSALEEHQSALELIMSKYREHVTRLVSGPTRSDHSSDTNGRLLEERTEKVCEMAAVMRMAVKLEEEREWEQRELLSRLLTENKGLRELLEISQRNASLPKIKRPVTLTEQSVQTEPTLAVGGNCCDSGDSLTVEITLPMPPVAPPRTPKAGKASSLRSSGGGGGGPSQARVETSPEPEAELRSAVSPVDLTTSPSASESDETSDDDSIKYDTIKLAGRRRTVVPGSENSQNNSSSSSLPMGPPDLLLVPSLQNNNNNNQKRSSKSSPPPPACSPTGVSSSRLSPVIGRRSASPGISLPSKSGSFSPGAAAAAVAAASGVAVDEEEMIAVVHTSPAEPPGDFIKPATSPLLGQKMAGQLAGEMSLKSEEGVRAASPTEDMANAEVVDRVEIARRKNKDKAVVLTKEGGKDDHGAAQDGKRASASVAGHHSEGQISLGDESAAAAEEEEGGGVIAVSQAEVVTTCANIVQEMVTNSMLVANSSTSQAGGAAVAAVDQLGVILD